MEKVEEMEKIQEKKKNIKKKKQKNKEVKDQEDLSTSSKIPAIELKKKKADGAITDTKQGPLNKLLPHQKVISNMGSENVLKFKKKKGTSSMHGFMYEVKMITLIFLKLLNLGYTFFLCSNLDGAGKFDDIVLKYTEKDGVTETLFIQLKHADSDNKKRSLSFVQEKQFFDLHIYFTSVCNSHMYKVDKDHKDVIFSSHPSNVRYLIITNADVNGLILSKKSNVSSFINNIVQQGDILKINDLEDYETFCYLIEAINEKERNVRKPEISRSVQKKLVLNLHHGKLKKILEICSEKNPSKEAKKVQNFYKNIDVNKFNKFVSNTIICSKQINDLDIAIKDEITAVTKMSKDETETVFNKLIDQMKFWWENETYYLTEECKLWFDIVKATEAARFKEREKELISCGVKFKDDIVKQLKDNISLTCGVVNIACNGERTDVTTLKVWQALDCAEKQNYILVSIKDCVKNEELIFRTWRNWWCKILVIDINTVEVHAQCKQFICKLYSEIESQPQPQSQVILISSESESLERCFKNNCKIVDNSTLDQFKEESQAKLFAKRIKFQGEEVPLNSILEEEYLKKLSSDALTSLIVEDVFTLGEDFSKYKTNNYIKRHLEIPYVNKNILDNDKSDIKIVLELESEQLAQKNLLLNVNDKCDNDIQNKESKAKEFETVNVHWVKQCKKTMKMKNVEERGLYSSNRNQNNELLLWKKSKGNIETVRKYLMKSEMYSLDEEKFITSDLESPVIITGEPGIGKSNLLKQMTASLKKAFPTKWVVFINLPQYCDYFDKVNDVLKKNVIEIVKMSLNLNDSSLQYFEAASKNFKNFILLIDAFDEMSPDYTDKVKQFITHVVNDSFFVYITSRPCAVVDLENHISAISYTVKNFNEDEARMCLKNFLKSKLTHSSEVDVQSLSEKLLTDTVNTQNSTFTTNPLHIMMLAEIYDEKDNCKLTSTLNILQIYTDFMKKKCAVSYTKFDANILNPTARMMLKNFTADFISYNMIMAMKDIFSQSLLAKFENKGVLSKNVENELLFKKIGITDRVDNDDDETEYIHRSFSEYFCAMWLAEHRDKCSDILRDIFYEKENYLIKMFFDLKCAENKTLHTAVITCDEKQLEKIKSGEILNELDTMNRSALHLAAAYNNVKAAQWLVYDTTHLIYKDKLSYTPIDYAILNFSWETMNEILPKMLSVSGSDKAELKKKLLGMKNKIIYECCTKGLQDLLSVLIEDDCHRGYLTMENNMELDPIKPGKPRYSYLFSEKFQPLFIAVQYNQKNIIEILEKNGCNIKDADGYGSTLLHIAAGYGHIGLVKHFIDLKKFDINHKNEQDDTPLLFAAKNGHIDIVKLLVEKGADINHANKYGDTALLFASEKGYLNIAEFCIEKDCNVNHANISWYSALLNASKYGHIEILELCVKKGADINHKNIFGNALLLASKMGHFEIVKFCIENGIEKNHADLCGDNALLHAAKEGYLEIMEYLVESGFDINYKNKDGFTALMYACKEGHFEIVKFCAEKHCEINHTNIYDDTALDCAYKAGFFNEVMECLENQCSDEAWNSNLLGLPDLRDKVIDRQLKIKTYSKMSRYSQMNELYKLNSFYNNDPFSDDSTDISDNYGTSDDYDTSDDLDLSHSSDDSSFLPDAFSWMFNTL